MADGYSRFEDDILVNSYHAQSPSKFHLVYSPESIGLSSFMRYLYL